MLRRFVPAVLREERQYRLLFTGQALSVLGDGVTALVLPFAVLQVGGGVAGVVTVSTAQFLPYVVLSLPAGVWADRFDRRRLIVLSDTVRLVVQVIAAVLLLTGRADVTVLVVLAAVFGAADAVFAPAITGLLPDTVVPANLQPANALRGLTFSVGSIAGPVVGGALLATIGPGGAFVFDAATFLVSAVCVSLLRLQAVERAVSHHASGFLADLRGGWDAVRTRGWVLAGLLGGAAYSVLVLPAIFVFGPLLAGERFGGPSGWAWITAGFGVGSLLGDLLLLRWRPRFGLRAAAVGLVVASCQALIIGSGLATAFVAGLEVVAGAGVTVYFTLWETSLQEHVPERSLSRVASYDYLTSTGLIPAGTLLAGALSQTLGVGAAVLAAGTVGVLCAFGVLAVPAVRRLPRAAGPDAGPADSGLLGD